MLFIHTADVLLKQDIHPIQTAEAGCAKLGHSEKKNHFINVGKTTPCIFIKIKSSNGRIEIHLQIQ